MQNNENIPTSRAVPNVPSLPQLLRLLTHEVPIVSHQISSMISTNPWVRRQNAGLLSIFAILGGGYYFLQYRREKRLQEISQGRNMSMGTLRPLVRDDGS